ncbi:hypothetical protein GH714_026368 [Hevea brasiliensis]|uniref:Chromo domain-containing protein n=1 Tax=Hevea brasiliensis TaxID=3981 RepID=A0A6A6M4X3_HEVBR|nr:hypothetical protein GH714_026293 [Hevea brasiliensis]KAF2307326.1 hypothetical protein GH714_026368 [Hevea brasiliensis]
MELTKCEFVQAWKEKVELAKASLAKASNKMKKWADTKRRHLEFEEGDMVIVKLIPQTVRNYGRVHKGLLRRYEGPFPMEKCIGKLAYRVKLPPHLECHPVFHVSFLKPYHADKDDSDRGKSHQAPTVVNTTLEHEVEEILAHRVVPPRGTHPGYKEYLMKWKGLSDTEASWERDLTLWQHEDKVQEYLRDTTRASPG